jgi:hypothetical protein
MRRVLAALVFLQLAVPSVAGAAGEKPPITRKLGSNTGKHVVPKGETHSFQTNMGMIHVEDGGHAIIFDNNMGMVNGSAEIHGNNTGRFVGSGTVYGKNSGIVRGDIVVHGRNNSAATDHAAAGTTMHMSVVGDRVTGAQVRSGGGSNFNFRMGSVQADRNESVMTVGAITLRSKGVMQVGQVTSRGITDMHIGSSGSASIEMNGKRVTLSRASDGNLVIEQGGDRKVLPETSRHQRIDLIDGALLVGDQKIEL